MDAGYQEFRWRGYSVWCPVCDPNVALTFGAAHYRVECPLCGVCFSFEELNHTNARVLTIELLDGLLQKRTR